VDSLIESGSIDEQQADSQALSDLRKTAKELDDLLEKTSAALARFTDCLSIVSSPEQQHPTRLGIMSLMRQPEFAYTEALLPIMQVLEDDTVLLHVLDTTAASGDQPQVRIGSENEAEQLSGVSVVACRYGCGPDGGIVAVIGPTRMDYNRALTAVRIASKTLGQE
jgi:heat-inducible transcriptional repressor